MSLADIGVAIDQKDPSHFVKTYLTCMAQGYTMSVPTDEDPQILTEKWEKILAKYRRDFSDEFGKGVSQRWLELLQQCQLDAPNLEAQLCQAAGIDIAQTNAEKPESRPQATSFTDLPKEVAKREGLTPAISDRYRQRQKAQETRLPELQKLNNVHAKAFKSGNASEFLVAHLTFAKHDQPKPVPKSTVPLNIRSGWEDIIAKEFNTIASDEFLEALTHDWFYLVNQKGIPTTAAAQAECLITHLAKANQASAPKNNSASGGSLFRKLFG